MSRYADQLPINLAPNGANFLLSTNDSDGKALERIPLDLVLVGGNDYTILDETALDVNSNVTLSAGNYLYVGNAPANFDLSGLADGERVEIINHTAHKVFLFGFTNWVWNGVTTALQTDKGLIVEKGGLIGVKHGGMLLFNTFPNGLGQDWREGLAPPILQFTYVSPGDTNGIIYYLGATKYNSSFSNPHYRGEIIASASSTIGAPRLPQGAFTRSNNGSGSTETVWHSASGSNHWLRIQFLNHLVKINSFELWASSFHSLQSAMGSNCKFQGSNDGSVWNDLLTFSPVQDGSGRYFSGLFLNGNHYAFYRFFVPSPQYGVIGDIELYGELLL